MNITIAAPLAEPVAHPGQTRDRLHCEPGAKAHNSNSPLGGASSHSLPLRRAGTKADDAPIHYLHDLNTGRLIPMPSGLSPYADIDPPRSAFVNALCDVTAAVVISVVAAVLTSSIVGITFVLYLVL